MNANLQQDILSACFYQTIGLDLLTHSKRLAAK